MLRHRMKAAYELAMSRSDAIDKCQSLGEQFIAHFHKVYTQHKNNFKHHCEEMQGWLTTARKYKLKSTNDFLTKTNLIDWFFTACSTTDEFFSNAIELNEYEAFMLRLLNDDSLLVQDALAKFNQ